MLMDSLSAHRASAMGRNYEVRTFSSERLVDDQRSRWSPWWARTASSFMVFLPIGAVVSAKSRVAETRETDTSSHIKQAMSPRSKWWRFQRATLVAVARQRTP